MGRMEHRERSPRKGWPSSQVPRGRPCVDSGCSPLRVIAHSRQLDTISSLGDRARPLRAATELRSLSSTRCLDNVLHSFYIVISGLIWLQTD